MKNKRIKKVLICGLLIALLVLLIVFLPRILNLAGYILWLFAPFLIAYGVSLLVNPMANGLQKRFRLPRGIAAVLVIVLTVGVLGGIVTGIIWKIVDEIRNVYEDLPIIYENIRETWVSVSDWISDFNQMLPKSVQGVFDDFSNRFLDWLSDVAKDTEWVRSAGNAAKKLPNIFIAAIVFLLSLYFMVSDSKTVSDAVKKPFSQGFIDRMSEFRIQIKRYVGGYIKAQLTIMCISFTLILIGLSILQIDYALVIALAVAIFDALPFFGSGAVLWPWAIISFITGHIMSGVGLIIIYLSVILMRQFIEPKIVSKNIGVHPLMTLMSMYVGYKVFSIGGMILGPLLMVLLVSLKRAGVFDNTIKGVRLCANRVCAELNKIKNSFKDEGE